MMAHDGKCFDSCFDALEEQQQLLPLYFAFQVAPFRFRRDLQRSIGGRWNKEKKAARTADWKDGGTTWI